MLPMKIANYIARACDLPGLFLGTFDETHIEYIYTIQEFQEWGIESGEACILVKSNHWLRGMIIEERRFSALVNLDGDDPVFELLKRHKKFPYGNLRDNDDGKSLHVNLLFKNGSASTLISSLTTAPVPSSDLLLAYQQMLTKIKTQAHNPTSIIAPGKKFTATRFIYPDMPAEDRSVQGYFDQRFRYLMHFGQSGLFGYPDAPHDTAYLLLLVISNTGTAQHYAFVKTKRFFRGLHYKEKKYTRQKIHHPVLLLDVEEPNIDWEAFIQKAAHYTHYARGSRRTVDISLFRRDGDFTATFTLPDHNTPNVPDPEIWEVLKVLIAQFPEGFRR